MIANRKKTRRLKCQTCHDFEQFSTCMKLGSVRQGAMLGCLRCKLLVEAALLFRNEWANKIEEENNLVELSIQKGLNDSRAPFYTALKWPSNITSPEIFEKIHIQITTEVASHPLSRQLRGLISSSRRIGGSLIPLLRSHGWFHQIQQPLRVSTSFVLNSSPAIRPMTTARRCKKM